MTSHFFLPDNHMQPLLGNRITSLHNREMDISGIKHLYQKTRVLNKKTQIQGKKFEVLIGIILIDSVYRYKNRFESES